MVEVDEAHLFKRKYNKGHRIKGESVWIFGGICRETKESFVVRVPNRKRRTLWPLLKKYVAPGTILVTDDFSSYRGVDRALGFDAHEVVVHKYASVNPIFPEIFTNGIESYWSKLKKAINRSGTDQFVYRKNISKQFGKRNYGSKLLSFLKDLKKLYKGPSRSF